MEQAFQKAQSLAQRKLQSEELKKFWIWTNAVWKTARGEPLVFSDRPYLIDVYKDNHPDIVFMKAAQMGISERLIAEAVWICDQKAKNVLFTFPTGSQLADFVQARLDPVLMSSEYLSQRTSKSDTEGQSVQKIGLKRIGNGFLYLRGSQNEKQITSVDADAVYLDERDRFMQENVPYIDKRLLASDLAWRREASTPTFPGDPTEKNNVHADYLNSDQRIWVIKCEHCRTWQELDFFKNLDLKEKTTVCFKCLKPINRLQVGEWLVQNPASSTHGYKINGLYNSKRNVAELIEESKTTTFSETQQFYNQVLGLPYKAEGEGLQEADLLACHRDYSSTPSDAGGTYAGADVGRKIHVVILKTVNRETSRCIWAGTVDNFLGPLDSLEELMTRFQIKCLVVDARPETRKVKELTETFPNRVFGALYPVNNFPVQQYYKWDDFKREVYLDRTISLDYLVSDIRSQRIELPTDIGYVSGFNRQMTAAARITEVDKRTGTSRAKWVENGPDHFFHAANYARIARLKGSAGDALIDYYTKEDKPSPQQNINDAMRWFRIRGERIF